MKRHHRLTTKFLPFVIVISLFMLLFISSLFSPSARAEFPDKVFAPYVDALHYPAFSLIDMYNQTGQKYFTLAFIISGGGCEPEWGGVIPLDDGHYSDQINFIRSVGGDVIVSFGGANGIELAMACTDLNDLEAGYQSVIDKYNLKWIDFDIEGGAVADHASLDRRNKVIRNLQASNPDLKVAFCLPVLPHGLTQDGLNLLQNAKDNGVRIDVVNIMAMDYGDWAAPAPEGKMGQYAIDAANNTRAQCGDLGINTAIGITPMIGQNDMQSERFYLSDASQLTSWAGSQSWVKLLSFWSANRDNGDCGETGWASPVCSGLTQTDFAFTNIFGSFTAGGGGNIWPTVSIIEPAGGTVFKTGVNVEITARAEDPDGSVKKVEFFNGPASLGIDTEAPYSITWNNIPEGSFSLTAVATDNQNASTVSPTVSITVGSGSGCTAPAWKPDAVYWGGDAVSHNGHEWKAKWWTQGDEPGTTGQWGVWEDSGPCAGSDNPPSNLPPVVNITAPADGAVFTGGDNITITAEAADSDGSVVQVEFFQGSTSLGVDNSAPYGIIWNDVPAGSYALTSVAMDDDGALTTSSAVPLTVNPDGGDYPDDCSGLLDYPEGRGTYRGGDRVQNNGNIYECKPWPYVGWANSTNPAYEPGVGWAWESAWIYVAPCR